MEGQFVVYYRVSTQRQGRSGLGLEAQKEAVENYLNGGNWELIGEFTEVETGKGSNALEKRPVLKEAIEFTKQSKAKLIIAKLDRLARNVHFVSGLMESKVPFVCADMSEANELTLHIMAAMAQYESRRISERTREALQAAKRRGIKLGKTENLSKGNKDRAGKAAEFAQGLKPTLQALRQQGLSQRAMVDHLNKTGIRSFSGKEWQLVVLQRVLKRLGIK